jgi:hypothetical protein
MHKQISSYSNYGSDTNQHIIILYHLIYEPDYYIPHPLWHYSVYYISKIFQTSIENAVPYVSAFYVTFWAYLVYYVVKIKIINLPSYLYPVITFFIVIIGPLIIPWYHKIIFLGQGSPNIWHNVTLWTVKPFALLSLLFLFSALHTNQYKYYFASIVASILSIFAKPSFIIMYLPALFLFSIINKHYNKRFIFFIIILSLISILILYIQYLHTFHEGESKIIIDFLGVWSRSSQNISVSIVLGLAFPLFFLLLHPSILQDESILISWLMIFIGIFYYAVFAQTGRFYSHGNFGWSYMIAMSILYLFSITKFFEVFKELKPWKRYTIFSLLVIQVIIGIYYFYKVLQGQNPIYIAVFL